MNSLIPLYAAMVVALHYCVGMEVGGFVVENVFLKLHSALHNKESDAQLPISSKVASNMMLLLCYLYNLGVVHTAFIREMMQWLVEALDEVHIELLLVMFKYCGQQFQRDDQATFRSLVHDLQSHARQAINEMEADQSEVKGRIKYMLETVTEFNSKKDRKSQAPTIEQIQQFRKWLGQVKTSIGGLDRDMMLRMSVDDILHADQRGRWWLPGASWKGKPVDEQGRKDEVMMIKTIQSREL